MEGGGIGQGGKLVWSVQALFSFSTFSTLSTTLYTSNVHLHKHIEIIEICTKSHLHKHQFRRFSAELIDKDAV